MASLCDNVIMKCLKNCLTSCCCCCHAGVQLAPPPPQPQLPDHLPEISLQDLDALVVYVASQVKHFDPQTSAATSSHQITCAVLSHWQDRKQVLSSFMQSLPENLTKEVAGAGQNLILPLLSRALGGVGTLHWLGLGFSFIGWSFDNIDKTAQYWQGCLELLRRIVRLLENTRKVWIASERDPTANFEESLKDTIEKAFHCAIICTSNLSDKYILRFLKAASANDAIASLKEQLDSAIKQNIEVVLAGIYAAQVSPIEQQGKYSTEAVYGGGDVMQRAMDYLQTDCDDIMAVCLHGMGGIGKSTLGKNIFVEFQNLETRVYRCCRVELPFEIKNEDLHEFQNQILHKLCYVKDEVSNSTDGKERLKEELRNINQSIFLYIDNALKSEHLSKLLPTSLYFPKGSRILITTRNEFIRDCVKNDLNIRSCELIEMRKLKEDLAKELLWQTIGGQEKRVGGSIEDLEKRVLELCDGLPLALKVVGSYIASEYEQDPTQEKEIWKNVVKAMESAKPLHGDIEDELYYPLMFSIKCLDEEFKTAFLDIVAFGVDERDWEFSRQLVGPTQLEGLRRRALVRKTKEDESDSVEIIEVHDVLKEMGMEMVANDKNEIRITSEARWMENNDSLANVVGLRNVTVKAEQLKQMSRLRILLGVKIEGECEEAKLRHLKIVRGMRSKTSRPFKFSECEFLKRLGYWSGVKDASNLEVLTHCRELEVLDLRRWEQLENVDVIQSFRCLTHVRFNDCPKIRSLPDGIANLTRLKKLMFNRCTSLQSLPDIRSLTGLTWLDLSGCGSLQSLPDMGSLTGLTTLDLWGCRSLQSLPNIGSLTGLTRLSLSGCESLQSLSDMGSLTGLRELDLSGCGSLQSLPGGVASLSMGLRWLDLTRCKRLRSLPDGLKCEIRGWPIN